MRCLCASIDFCALMRYHNVKNNKKLGGIYHEESDF